MFAIVMCLVLVICTLTICCSMLCVLMVEGMSVAVNVMLYFGCFCFRGGIGFLDCHDICMCLVNKHFELL